MSSDDRIKQFKNVGRGDIGTLRSRRNETTVQLRREKKDDQLFKRRNIELQSTENENDEENDEPVHAFLSMEAILGGLYCSDPEVQLQAAQATRKILSKELNPPIKTVIDAGVVPILVQFLSRSESANLQFEAAWALTNIAAGTSKHTQCVVNAGAVPGFIDLLSSDHVTLREQCVWALGNIAGDGPALRDALLKHGILKPLLSLVNSEATESFMRNLAWTLSNLCRNKNPPPSFDSVKRAIPTFAYLLRSSDKEVVSDACWAFSYLTDGSNEQIQTVINSGVVGRLIELLQCDHLPILTPALRSVGNIVTGNDLQTQRVIDEGILPCLKKLITYPKSNIQKEAAWTVSNIAAGNSSQIEGLIQYGIMSDVINLLQSSDYKTIKESTWAITNFTSGATLEQMNLLLQADVLISLGSILACADSMILLVALDAIKNLLMTAQKVGQIEKMALSIEEVGVLDKLEMLQNHENVDVFKAASGLIEAFFSEDQDVEIEPLASKDGYEFENFDQLNRPFQF